MAETKKCFVIMPFGQKTDVDGEVVDFDTIYLDVIVPAIEATGLQPFRADEATEGGFIHRKMIEHIHEDPVAVVDISLLNANVFYELGIRHSLREAVTVLIRRRGTTLPFNISNLSVIEYDETNSELLSEARARMSSFITNGLTKLENDSLVHEVLDIRIDEKIRPLPRSLDIRYKFKERPGKSISLRTGDITKIKDIDVWVNSENTDMQMARFHDWSISSVIRYGGAEKDATGRVTEDIINNALREVVGDRTPVQAGVVIPTPPGALQRSNNVKQVFHVAAVVGEIGHGYRPIENLGSCITNAMTLVDSEFSDSGITSILFPLLGAGIARDRLREIVDELIGSAVAYITDEPDTVIDKACFLAWSQTEFDTSQSSLAQHAELNLA